jgi:plasmid stabilization system protein ParE
MHRLEQFPERCGMAPESEQIGREIRQLLYGRRGGVYRALFVVEKDEVHVLHIRHAARDTMTSEEFR